MKRAQHVSKFQLSQQGCLEMSGLDPNKVYPIHLPEFRVEDSGGHWRASDGIGSGEYGQGHLKGVQMKRNDNRD
ncbi:hypothetical protein E4U54_000803 [Claviceps lovelessii]|nr:hypothetical protein E4U54_000803 [Claviceps lovelessii]